MVNITKKYHHNSIIKYCIKYLKLLKACLQNYSNTNNLKNHSVRSYGS